MEVAHFSSALSLLSQNRLSHSRLSANKSIGQIELIIRRQIMVSGIYPLEAKPQIEKIVCLSSAARIA
jgi:hypothetical protein